MNDATGAKISFLELAKRVIEKESKPMTEDDIWQNAQQTGLVSLLNSTGKTPKQSLAARLYTDVKKASSPFSIHGSSPAKFFLKSLDGSALDVEQQVALQPTAPIEQKSYKERELHPLLVCTIYHEKGVSNGEKQNQWIHPDVVGFTLTTKDWTPEVVQLAQTTKTSVAKHGHLAQSH